MLNLDTHILLHALAGELTAREAGLLREQPWSISAIVIWEIGKLAELGRIELDLDDVELTRTVARLHVWPLTLEICRAIRTLDFRGDPADEIIAATSLAHRVPLVTRDRRIRRSRQVPLARI
ncbi:MAG TPA: PIN domain-containing protein [Methylomirabilota bacterium]|jgi:PIN domain nuclease of toxin-antitoxin system